MTAATEARVAADLLRIVLEGEATAMPSGDLVSAVARRGRLTVRVAETRERRGREVPGALAAAADRARTRTERLLELVDAIGPALSRAGIDHVFLSIARDYPDSGSDLDILVGGSPNRAGLVIERTVPATRDRAPIHHPLSRTTVYPLPALDTAIDLHHGAIGPLADDRRYAAALLARRRVALVGPVACFVPVAEDQLLLQAFREFRGWPTLRLNDVLWSIAGIRTGQFDWDRTIEASREAGLRVALGRHLRHIEQIHRKLFRRPLVDPALLARLPVRRGGSIRFHHGVFRSSLLEAWLPLHLDRLAADLKHGDWAAIGRRSLFPLIAVPAAWRRVAGAVRGGH